MTPGFQKLLGDQITAAFIRDTECPTHGGAWCTMYRGMCKHRIDRAIIRWHRQLMRSRHGDTT